MIVPPPGSVPIFFEKNYDQNGNDSKIVKILNEHNKSQTCINRDTTAENIKKFFKSSHTQDEKTVNPLPEDDTVDAKGEETGLDETNACMHPTRKRRLPGKTPTINGKTPKSLHAAQVLKDYVENIFTDDEYDQEYEKISE